MTNEPESRARVADDKGWARAAKGWGIFSGIAFAVATLAYLVEATGLIGSAPTYAATAAGQLQDEATYWAAFFAYRHATLWDYVLRDGLFFVAFLGFIPLVLATNVATGGRRAAVQIAGAFIAVGAIFGALNAVAFLVDVSWWRGTGWEQVPPGLMAAIGRGTELMDDLSAWSGIASNAALAIGLAYLGVACLTEPALSRPIGRLALATAALEVVITAAGQIGGLDSVENVLSLITGALFAPLILIGLGLRLSKFLTGRSPITPQASIRRLPLICVWFARPGIRHDEAEPHHHSGPIDRLRTCVALISEYAMWFLRLTSTARVATSPRGSSRETAPARHRLGPRRRVGGR